MSSNPFGRPAAGKEAEDVFEVQVPEGDGDFLIDEDEVIGRVVSLEKATSEAGNPMWTWTFAVNEGKNAGKELRSYTALTPAAMWKLREMLEALGLGEAGGTAKFTKKDAIGRLCVLHLEPDTYKGVKRSTIASVSPHPDGAGTRAKPKAAGPVPGAPKPPVSGKPAGASKPKPPATPPPADPPEDEADAEAPPEDDVPF